MNKRFASFLSHMWWVYLLLFIASIGLGYGAYIVFSLPSTNETISLFIGSSYVNKDALSKKLMAHYEGTNIKEITIDYSDPASSYYATTLQTRGLVNTDALILASDSISDINYSRYFAPLNSDIILQYQSSSFKYATYQEEKYGIEVNQALLKDMIIFSSNLDYYLFFNKKSEKIGLLNNSNSDEALLLINGVVS